MNICRCSVLRPSLLLTWFFEGNYVLLLLGGDSRMTVVLANEQRLGTVHFLRERGGWWDLGGGHAKKNGFRGGAIPKKLGKKGGPSEIF